MLVMTSLTESATTGVGQVKTPSGTKLGMHKVLPTQRSNAIVGEHETQENSRKIV